MNTHRLFRFRIRSILALTAVVAGALGAWIWFRQTRLNEARQLAEQDIGVLSTSDAPSFLPKQSRSDVPFVRPALAEIYVHLGRDGSVRLDGRLLSQADANAAILEKRDRIFAAGIRNVQLLVVSFECSVAELMASTEGRDATIKLMEFAGKNSFTSTGFLEANQIEERKRSLDPQGVVHPK